MGTNAGTNKDAPQLAKSLHTISVLINVAQHFRTHHNMSAKKAMAETLKVLQLETKSDIYGLAETALARVV